MISPNLVILASTDKQDISDKLAARDVNAFHVTNGTYAYKAEMIVPTMLAGFQYVTDKVAKADDALVIAVNSDISMQGIYKKQGKSQADIDALEGQLERALKVAEPLAQQNPDRHVIVLFYDDETPTDLYTKLAGDGVNLKSLFKWGYGTDPNAKGIEGAENFGMVLAYPLVNDVKPVCEDITVKRDQAAIITVRKLTEETGKHGAPYISAQGKVLFPVPDELKSHHQDSVPVTAAAPAAGKLTP